MSYFTTTHSRTFRREFCLQPDMAPLADLAFLLVAFFMLSSKIIVADSVEIHLPKSSGYLCGGPSNQFTIFVSKEGKVFFDMDNNANRVKLVKEMGSRYKVQLSNHQIASFSSMDIFGMDINQLPAFLNSFSVKPKNLVQPGIPVMKGNDQLSDWLQYARLINPRVGIVLKCDESNHFPIVKEILDILKRNNISRFSLLTEMEHESYSSEATE